MLKENGPVKEVERVLGGKLGILVEKSGYTGEGIDVRTLYVCNSVMNNFAIPGDSRRNKK